MSVPRARRHGSLFSPLDVSSSTFCRVSSYRHRERHERDLRATVHWVPFKPITTSVLEGKAIHVNWDNTVVKPTTFLLRLRLREVVDIMQHIGA